MMEYWSTERALVVVILLIIVVFRWARWKNMFKDWISAFFHLCLFGQTNAYIVNENANGVGFILKATGEVKNLIGMEIRLSSVGLVEIVWIRPILFLGCVRCGAKKIATKQSA